MNSIKRIRESRNIRQVELAKLLNVTQGAISQWETGNCLPQADMLPQIAKVLDCTIDELLQDKSSA